MTISSLLEGGFRLIRERPGAMLIWAVISLVMAIAISFANMWILQGSFDALMSGESMQSVQLSASLKQMLIGLVSLMASTVVYAAVMRAIIHPDEGGPGWLRFGMDEVRLFLILLLYLVIGIVALFVVALFSAPFVGVASGGALALVLIVAGFAVCAFFGTRVSLTFPLTLKERAFAISAGWRLTSGRFWTLFGAYLIVLLILLGVGIASIAVTKPEMLSAIFQHGINSPEAEQASTIEYQKLLTGMIDAPIIIGWVLSAVQGAVSYALLGGVAATAVQQLTADQAGLSETFS